MPWSDLEAALPDALRTDLRPGAPAAALDAAEAAHGLALPGDVRALYGVHDGQAGGAPGVVGGLRLLPVAEAAAEGARWRDVLATTPDLAGLDVEAHPPGAVRPDYWNARWVPLADDGAGNGLALDLDPGEAGTLGQVVTVGADEPARRVVAPSLGALLERLAAAWGSGALALDGLEARFRDGRTVFDGGLDA